MATSSNDELEGKPISIIPTSNSNCISLSVAELPAPSLTIENPGSILVSSVVNYLQ